MKNTFQTFSTWVFNRLWIDTTSSRKFYIVIALVLARWFIWTAFMANRAIQINFIPDTLFTILLWLVVPFIWIFIAIKSKNPFISFLWYNFIIVPFGILLWPVVNQYSPDIVRNAFFMTAFTSIVMGILATINPNFFSKIWTTLFMSLIALVLIRILQIFIPSLNIAILDKFIPSLNLGLIDYIWATIFSLYIWYDMYRANKMPKTIDNAIDICIDLYLDIINLFLYMLRIMGRKK